MFRRLFDEPQINKYPLNIMFLFYMIGVCVCNQGFIGNGQDCSMICAMNEMFDGEKCIKNSELIEEGKTLATFSLR